MLARLVKKPKENTSTFGTRTVKLIDLLDKECYPTSVVDVSESVPLDCGVRDRSSAFWAKKFQDCQKCVDHMRRTEDMNWDRISLMPELLQRPGGKPRPTLLVISHPNAGYGVRLSYRPQDLRGNVEKLSDSVWAVRVAHRGGVP